jgi:putative peptidoglycan lipid II flippase
MLLPVGIVGQSLGTAVFPTFSEQNARQEHDDFRRTFSATFRPTLYLTIPAAVGLFILGGPLIALVFQRGEFDAHSTVETAWALQFYSIALFAHSSLEILTRAFYAMHDTRTPVLVGGGAMVLNVALSFALIAPLAQGGLALANSIATILEMLTLLMLLRRRMIGVDEGRIALAVVRIAAGSLAMGAVLVAFVDVFAARGPVFTVVLGTALGAGVYLIATTLLRSEEIGFVLQRVRIRRD